jgi:hypothetical protein
MSVRLSDYAAAFGAMWEDGGSRGVNGNESAFACNAAAIAG